MPVHGDGQDGQTDLDIMANDISYGAGFFDQSMSGYDMNDGGEFFLDSDNSPIPIDGFDEPPSPTNSFGHAPMKSSSRSSVADSGSSSEGKQSSIGTGLTGIDTHADKELVVKQEWSGAGISNYFGENGLQPDTFYTAASSPSHLDGSFNAGLDLSPNTTTNMRDLDLSVQTTNMQSLELRSPVYSPHTTMHALAPDAMLQNATNSYTFGSHHNLMPFNFGSARNAVGKGASPEPNPFSPSMLPQPSPIVPSPIAQQYNGLPSGPYPGPYPQLRMGDFENSQMVSAAAPFPLANPAPQAPAQPRFNGKLLYGSPPYTLEIWDNCLDARRSRVETQIRVVLAMSHLPPGVKRLHLPTYTISKPKLVAKPTPEPSSDMLELHVSVVCTSAVQKPHQMQAARDRARKASEKVRSKPALPSSDSGEEVLKPQDGGEVFICNGCICRERKRIARKKNNKRQDEEELWKEDEKYRAIVFNNAEVLDWNSPQSPVDELGQPQSTSGHGQLWTIPAAMRLACYCRHHTEKMGYNVIFTLTDYKGQFIAQSVLKSIFITDDHKTSNQANLTTSIPGAPRLANGHEFHVPPLNHEFISNSNSSMSMSGAVPGSQVQMSQQGSSARILSRSVSPVAYPSERKKMRKTSDTSKLAVGANMPSLDATMFSAQQPPNSASAFPPTPPQCSDMSVFGPSSARPADRNRGPYSSNPPTPSHYQRGPFANLNATAAGIDHANPGVYSGLTSMHQSRATSPATVINTNTINMRPNPALAIRTQPEMGLAPGLANTGAVAIHKVIPGEGSVMGGMDVTILGENFQGGMEVMFGNTKAVTTTFWGEKTLVCLVPPAAAPGRVQVTIKDHELTVPGNPQFFNYTNDADVQLLRTALAVLGGKLTGNNFNDVIGWANQFNNQFVQQQSSGSSSGNDASGAGGGTRYNRATESDFESQLINLLKMMDLAENSRPVRFNLRRKTGQTMMHLACHMGFARFVDGLLIRGANPDARDRGGYTPLHMAALAGHLDIVSLLIAKGADTTIRTLSGVTAMDIASSETVGQAIGRFGLQTRSRSGVSLPSRANSTVDFKIQPLTNTSTNAVDSGEESPEYSTFATSEEDALSEEEGSSEEEQEEWLDMQHKGISKNLILEDKPARRHRRPTDIVGGFGLPATAMTTLKEHMSAQFQQLHQSMQQHLPNLPQLPQLPQIAQFAQLPQFSYLPQMPNIPNLPPALKERDWWLFLSSLAYSNAAQNTQAPPAYNEIFPHDRGSLDDKQASAVQAAVEAEADVKCSALYDQAGSLSSNVDNAQDVVDVKKAGFVVNAKSSKAGVVVEDKEPPTLLQIGRKNAITKEQQENFLRARAAKLKEMSWDKNLFFIWIPILIAMATLWLYSHSPRFAEAAWKLTSPVRGFVLGEVQ